MKKYFIAALMLLVSCVPSVFAEITYHPTVDIGTTSVLWDDIHEGDNFYLVLTVGVRAEGNKGFFEKQYKSVQCAVTFSDFDEKWFFSEEDKRDDMPDSPVILWFEDGMDCDYTCSETYREKVAEGSITSKTIKVCEYYMSDKGLSEIREKGDMAIYATYHSVRNDNKEICFSFDVPVSTSGTAKAVVRFDCVACHPGREDIDIYFDRPVVSPNSISKVLYIKEKVDEKKGRDFQVSDDNSSVKEESEPATTEKEEKKGFLGKIFSIFHK